MVKSLADLNILLPLDGGALFQKNHFPARITSVFELGFHFYLSFKYVECCGHVFHSCDALALKKSQIKKINPSTDTETAAYIFRPHDTQKGESNATRAIVYQGMEVIKRL